MNSKYQKVPPLEGFREADYSKFTEWMLLKKYSPQTVVTTIRVVEYFRSWAAAENIFELEQISYSDAMGFMQRCSRQGVSQKTIANYLGHIRKFYQFLMSEGEVRENPVAHIKVQGIKRKMYYDILNTEELQTLYNLYPEKVISEDEKDISAKQQNNILMIKRNKMILSLLIYQGLRVEELAVLKVQDLHLREGKIMIHAQRRTAARTMKLESHQVYGLMDYMQEVRKAFLQANGTTDKLFMTLYNSGHFYNITSRLLKHLRKINPACGGTGTRIKNLDQIRASVITTWIQQYDLRKVQYLAGHKYVSSTEKYKANVIDELQDDITKFHPL